MAAQVIRCPAHMLASFPIGEFRESSDDPGISIEAQGRRAICVVSLDRRLAQDHWPPFGHRTLALVLIGEAETEVQDEPRRLPHDVIVPLIDALATHAAPHFTGHDWVELGAILEAAKHAPGDLPRPSAWRLPRSRLERKLCETALILERRWSKELEGLDRGLAGYGDQLQRTGLGPIITDLATEGAVADLLQLVPDGAPNRYRAPADHPALRDALTEAMRRSGAARYATWWTLLDLKNYGTYQNGEVSPAIFEELYRFGCAFPVPDWGQRLWRRDELTGSDCPPSVPSRGVDLAMRQLAAACDRRLLGQRHPLIRAALVTYMFMRARPFGESDPRAAELLFNLLLRQMDLPPLPIMLMFHRRDREVAAAIDGALAHRRPEQFVDAALHLLIEALSAGKAMLDPLRQEYGQLTGALKDARYDRSASDTAATILLSNVLTPRINEEPDAECIEPQALHLHGLGLIDLIEVGLQQWWSSPVARLLVGTPITRHTAITWQSPQASEPRFDIPNCLEFSSAGPANYGLESGA
jgi:hypothetical protein